MKHNMEGSIVSCAGNEGGRAKKKAGHEDNLGANLEKQLSQVILVIRHTDFFIYTEEMVL